MVLNVQPSYCEQQNNYFCCGGAVMGVLGVDDCAGVLRCDECIDAIEGYVGILSASFFGSDNLQHSLCGGKCGAECAVWP